MKDEIYRLNWEEWVEYCAEHGIDPRKHREDGRDLGGGNSITIMCSDEPPEKDPDEAWKNARDVYCCTKEDK